LFFAIYRTLHNALVFREKKPCLCSDSELCAIPIVGDGLPEETSEMEGGRRSIINNNEVLPLF
jgi:hypothetical protein